MGNPVIPAERGSFLDLWRSSNVPRKHFASLTRAISSITMARRCTSSDIYRTDFMTDLAQKSFWRSSPGEVSVSADAFLPRSTSPERYRLLRAPERICGPLQRFLGAAGSASPARFVSRINPSRLLRVCSPRWSETVGTIRKTLEETGLAQNTTRDRIHQRSWLPFQDTECRIQRGLRMRALVHKAPVFSKARGSIGAAWFLEIVSHVDLAPSLLSAVGLRPCRVPCRGIIFAAACGT